MGQRVDSPQRWIDKKLLKRINAECGRFLRWREDFRDFLTIHENTMLAYLMNYASGLDLIIYKRNADGWFFCPAPTIMADLRISNDGQRRAIQGLRKKKIVEMKQKGNPARRHLRIDYQRILDLLEVYRKKKRSTKSKEESPEETEFWEDE